MTDDIPSSFLLFPGGAGVVRRFLTMSYLSKGTGGGVAFRKKSMIVVG